MTDVVADQKDFYQRKKVPTEIKHLILEKYIASWGGIILQGNKGRRVRLAFVDTCAGSGLFGSYDIEAEPLLGSPLIGINSLHALATHERNINCDMQSKALLIEKDEKTFRSLKAAIEKYAPNQENVEAIHGEFAEKIDNLLQFCEDYFSLVLIDPFGPSSVPFWAVSRVVAQKYTDITMHFPSNAILRMSGHLTYEPANRISQERVKWLDDFFGSPDWRKIVDSSLSTEEKEERWIQFYLDRLRLFSKDILPISIPLLFETKERPIYHLIFMTRNLSGLMEMKRIMQQAKEYEAFRREQVKQQMRIEKTRQGELFEIEKTASVPSVNIDELAKQLHHKFKSKSVTREVVYRFAIFLENVLKTNIDKALTLLKRQRLLETPAGKASLNQLLKFL